MEWDKERAAEAELIAKQELEEMLETLSEEEQEVLKKFSAFWRRWYNGNKDWHAVGHKFLGRLLISRMK
jgi:hypothetical protein